MTLDSGFGLGANAPRESDPARLPSQGEIGEGSADILSRLGPGSHRAGCIPRTRLVVLATVRFEEAPVKISCRAARAGVQLRRRARRARLRRPGRGRRPVPPDRFEPRHRVPGDGERRVGGLYRRVERVARHAGAGRWRDAGWCRPRRLAGRQHRPLSRRLPRRCPADGRRRERSRPGSPSSFTRCGRTGRTSAS